MGIYEGVTWAQEYVRDQQLRQAQRAVAQQLEQVAVQACGIHDLQQGQSVSNFSSVGQSAQQRDSADWLRNAYAAMPVNGVTAMNIANKYVSGQEITPRMMEEIEQYNESVKEAKQIAALTTSDIETRWGVYGKGKGQDISIKKQKEQSMLQEVKNDMKNMVKEHKSIIYWTVMLYLVDRFIFEGRFKAKLQEIVQRLIGKVESELDRVGAPREAGK